MLQAIVLLEAEIERIKTLSRVFKAKADRLPDFYARAKYREEEARRLQIIVDILEREYYDNKS